MFSFKTKLSMARAILTKRSPFYIQFYVSKFCHLKCKMCNIVEANRDLTPFGADKIEKIADNLVKIGAGVVLLTGGEPFLRGDIDQIVGIFKARKLDVRLQTAGLRTNRGLIRRCFENGARDINISIDSLDADLADYINGVKGSWRDAIETIAFVSNNFPPDESICALGCVLSPYNIDEIDAILDFATEIGWWLSLVPAHITRIENPLNFRGYDEYFRFQSADFDKVGALIQRLKYSKRQGYNLFDSDNYLDSIFEFITKGQPSWRHKGICDTPNLYFAILPDGQFAPCCDHRIGESVFIYDDDFPRIYKSRRFRKSVRKIASSCPGCNFGSYPEMTLTIRSLITLKERILLQFRAGAIKKKALSVDELMSIIERVRGRHAVYEMHRDYAFRNQKVAPPDF